jgi:glucosamine--fructose-6-phosphate aminotransferase (isomerizing)
MCGISGYVGAKPAARTAVENLKRLEYRGYDSSGVVVISSRAVQITKAPGKIAALEQLLGTDDRGGAALAHTRWATHGRPTQHNAHPHADCTGRLAVVHNGIVENHAELRTALQRGGHEFVSETDTEVLAHLIEHELPDGAVSVQQFFEALRTALAQVRGSYGLGVLCAEHPDTVFLARQDSPLIIGIGNREHFVASDIPAVLRHTRRIVVLEDGDSAVLTPADLQIVDAAGCPVQRHVTTIDWDDATAELGGYPHYMLKEIYEGPRTVRETLRGRMHEDGTFRIPELAELTKRPAHTAQLHITACGTALHAGMAAREIFQKLLQRTVEVTPASEFRYGDPLVGEQTLVILISQSGETADTLAAMREAKRRGATTLAIVNVAGSTLAREADHVLLTQAGPEIGVASTKAYLAQLTALTLVALHLAHHMAPEADLMPWHTALLQIPTLLETCLTQNSEIQTIAHALQNHHGFFYLGRLFDYPTAVEAALKLKEISYLHAEAYAAGEMKHGPLALVEQGVAVVGIATQRRTHEKLLSNLQEAKAREGTILALVREDLEVPSVADHILKVPKTLEPLMPVVSIVPLQLLAYHIADARGCPIDQPRNLAKSVTVE